MSSFKRSWLLLVLFGTGVGIISWQNLAAQPDHLPSAIMPQAVTSNPLLPAAGALPEPSGPAPGMDVPSEGTAASVPPRDPWMEARAAFPVKEADGGSQPPDRHPPARSRASRVVEAFTEPYRDIAVAASEMGTVAEILVREGQSVRAGEIVAALDQDVLRAALEVARRSMASEGALKSAQADLARKSEELAKLTGLKDRGHASHQEVDRVDADRRVADARLLSVREELEVRELEARRIEAQIEERMIRSPIDGIVTELRREAGEFVSPSDPVVARIVQLDPLLIVFAIPVEYRDELHADQLVTVTIGEAHPEERKGIVEFVAPTPDPSYSSVRVKVRIANPGQRIRSGERTTLNLDAQQAD